MRLRSSWLPLWMFPLALACGVPAIPPDDGGTVDSGTVTADGGFADAGQSDAGADGGMGDDAGMVADAGQDAGVVSFSAQIQPIFSAHCTGCHAGSFPSAGMNLSSGVAYAQVVEVVVGCAGAPGSSRRIKPGDLSQSMLWLKVSNDPARCGDRMPQPPNPALNSTNLGLIQTWIEQGAPNN